MFPDPDPAEMGGFKRRVEVHVLPGRLDPVAIEIACLIMTDEKLIHKLVIFSMVVMANCDVHIDVLCVYECTGIAQ
jgi:hypothetical protein